MKAFSLIEIIIVVTLFSSVLLIGAPLSLNYITQSELDSAMELSLKQLNTAQSLAQAGSQDSTWGVKFESHKIVLFKGPSYEGRDGSFDIETVFSNKISFSGLNELVYSKYEGIPSNIGTVGLATSQSSKSIIINALGVSEY